MKLATKILSLLVMIGLATFYMSCDSGGGDDKTEEEKQLIKLVSKWNLLSATDQTGDRTSDFPDLVLELSGSYAKGGTYQYKFTGTRPDRSPWPANGTWKFGSQIQSDLIRDPGQPGSGSINEVPMTYSVTDTQLSIEFIVDETSNGWEGGTTRAKSVTGEWNFVFTKQ